MTKLQQQYEETLRENQRLREELNTAKANLEEFQDLLTEARRQLAENTPARTEHLIDLVKGNE